MNAPNALPSRTIEAARLACRRGERLRVGVPHGHWKTTTFVAGLRSQGIAAPFVIDGPINRIAFETYVDKVLVPELTPGDIVITAGQNRLSNGTPRWSASSCQAW